MSWQDVADTITKLHYWLAKPGSELQKLRRAAVRFWQRVEAAFTWTTQQIDPMTAQLALVDLLAWERNVERIASETEWQYRTRVRYALPFAKGAGMTAGWLDMFEKLGMGHITINERVENIDFDVVILQLLDSDVGTNQDIINYICRRYGRTTRRYQYSTVTVQTHMLAAASFDYQSSFDVITARTDVGNYIGFFSMDNDSQLAIVGMRY
ncbi:phage tail protein [Shewanella sp.]|uniref:phage tail protein n=1 Tax=Shewanella sp. TaxID=50422 RepID=UPI003A977C98